MKENGEVTDTNVGDIEEDIKKLRESIIEEKYHIYNKDLKIILEHILSDYKRVLKENEHKTEKIENQKSELEILNNKQKDLNKLQNTLSSYKGQFRRQEKENEELGISNKYTIHLTDKQYNAVIENAQNDINQKWIQKVKDKIEELQKEYSKLDKQVDEYIKSVEKDVSTYYENKERISIMQTLSYFIDTLKELIEEREEE